MIREYATFKVKIRESEFTTSSGQILSSSAVISFYDQNKKELFYTELGYLDLDSIYRLIDQQKPLDLSQCYIENFSLSSYRKLRKLGPEAFVVLSGFNAEGAIFDSAIFTDFSRAEFPDAANFERTSFCNGKVSFNGCRFGDGKVNFAYSHFNDGNVDFANAEFGEGSTIFKNSSFKTGHKDFQYTNFGAGEISFVNTEFGEGDVSFINTYFNTGNVSFKVAIFGPGKVDFHFAKFGKGDISFERVVFGGGRLDFRKVEFDNGKINFNRAEFGDGDIDFEACQLIDGRMTFKRSSFGAGKINFEQVEMANADLVFESIDFGVGNVSFNSAQLNSLSLKSCHLDNYFDIRVHTCNYIDLSDTIVRDIIDIQPYLEDVRIGCLNMSGMRLLGRIDIDWKRNNVFSIIDSQQDTSFHEKAEQFRILKENYGNIGNYEYEDIAYIHFKRYEQKADFEAAIKKSKANAVWQYPVYLFKWIIFDKMGLYATSPGRVLSSLVIVYFCLSMIHFVAPFLLDTNINCIPQDADILYKLLTTMYYSLVTFTTVGYGDCSPVGFLRLIAAIEGFVGVFMMSYFTVAFARKILR